MTLSASDVAAIRGAEKALADAFEASDPTAWVDFYTEDAILGALAIKVIVELQAKPGGRSELAALLDSIVAREGPTQRGFLGSTRYEVPDDPDMLVEIAEWESVEARLVHMEEAAATGTYVPVLEMLAAPFRATVIRQLP